MDYDKAGRSMLPPVAIAISDKHIHFDIGSHIKRENVFHSNLCRSRNFAPPETSPRTSGINYAAKPIILIISPTELSCPHTPIALRAAVAVEYSNAAIS